MKKKVKKLSDDAITDYVASEYKNLQKMADSIKTKPKDEFQTTMKPDGLFYRAGLSDDYKQWLEP